MAHPGSPITPRLRLRRAFLRAAIVSLAVGGVVAVAALLLNQFNETTGRILVTLVALAFHCGAAMALLGRMDLGPSATFARIALIALAAEFAVLLFAIWGRGWLRGEGFFTMLFVWGACVLARPGARILEGGPGPRPLGWATVGAAVLALALSLIALWSNLRGDEVAQAAGTAAVIAFTLAQFAALFVSGAVPESRVPDAQATAMRVLFLAALVAAALVGLGIVLMIWDADYFQSEVTVRVLGAIGVIDVCATLVLAVMARLRATPQDVRTVVSVRDVWLRCPRCATEQTIAIGGAACALRIDVEVEATHCATCGYVLANLPSRVCPECGTGF